MKDYIKINEKAYDTLAKEYEKRAVEDDYEIKEDFWISMFKKLIVKNNTKVLEIGPGNGRNLKMFDELNCDTTAVELSKRMSEIAKRRSPNSKIINGNILEYNFEKESFDIIFAAAVIHNFPLEDAKRLINKIESWLKNDGYLIIATTIHEIENSGVIVKEDYNGKVKRYRHQYTQQSFEKLIKKNGFRIYDCYTAFEKERNKNWYLLVCQKDYEI